MQEQESNRHGGNITRDKAKQSLGLVGGYTVCQRELILDSKLSAIAKELFLIAWQLPLDFYLSEHTLTNYMINKGFDTTRKTVHKKLAELEKLGYVSKVKCGYVRDNGVTRPLYRYTLHEISKYLASDLLCQQEQDIDNSIACDIDF